MITKIYQIVFSRRQCPACGGEGWPTDLITGQTYRCRACGGRGYID